MVLLPLELNDFHQIVAVFLFTPHNSQALSIIIPMLSTSSMLMEAVISNSKLTSRELVANLIRHH